MKGAQNWPAAQKHKVLIPIAAIKQLCHDAAWYLTEEKGLHAVRVIKKLGRKKRIAKIMQ